MPESMNQSVCQKNQFIHQSINHSLRQPANQLISTMCAVFPQDPQYTLQWPQHGEH